MIIVSITGPTMAEALAQMSASRRYAEMFELRLDLIAKPDIVGLLTAARKPVIAACRTKKSGGSFSGSERDRSLLLELSAAFGSNYIDIELSDKKEFYSGFLSNRRGGGILLSHHSDRPPADVPSLYKRMKRSGADVVKIAYGAEDSSEIRQAMDFLSLARKDNQKAIAIAMGEAGEASRVLYRVMGAWGTYASPETGAPAASGQIAGSVLKKLYRADKLDPKIRVFGYPLGQSKGVLVHNPLFQSAGSNSVYCRFPVRNLGAFMKSMGPMMAGFSVTQPHKQAIIKYLKSTDQAASAIGAVNTVIRKPDGLWGTNTDGQGALDALESLLKVAEQRVLILGAGGAARAIAFEARHRGAVVTIANRTNSKAEKLASDLGLEWITMGSLGKASFDILVNATSVGMTPKTENSPVHKTLLKGKTVFDAVYNPPMTRLLMDARDSGSAIVSGVEMYVNQAAKQSELYLGRKPLRKRMQRLLGL